MASNVTFPPGFTSGPAAIFGGAGYDNDLGAAIQAGFGLIGYRGKTWSIRYKGDEIPLLRSDGSGDPMNSIELVIVKSPNHLSKTWYETTFQEGSSAAPDCASSNGVVPDASSPKKQNDVCITCKWNQFGSRKAADGQQTTFKGKACSDNKRLAVVPLGDIKNEQFGGPLLLRVPPASLGDLSNLNDLLKQIGFPYYAAGVKVSFDTTVAYPRFVFKPMRALTEEEGKLVMELRDLSVTDKIIHGDPATQGSAPQQEPPNPNKEPLHPDNVVTMPKQVNPAADPAKATTVGGFGSSKEAPASKATNNGSGADAPEKTGVAQFDAALDKKLEGLL